MAGQVLNGFHVCCTSCRGTMHRCVLVFVCMYILNGLLVLIQVLQKKGYVAALGETRIGIRIGIVCTKCVVCLNKLWSRIYLCMYTRTLIFIHMYTRIQAYPMSRHLHARIVTLCAQLVTELLSENLDMNDKLAHNATGEDVAGLDAPGEPLAYVCLCVCVCTRACMEACMYLCVYA
jgi:hypothetical protein